MRHFSPRTEKAYVGWIRRYIFFHGVRHPDEMGSAEVVEFLSDLAVRGSVAASTQNQALAALLFLYRHVPRPRPLRNTKPRRQAMKAAAPPRSATYPTHHIRQIRRI